MQDETDYMDRLVLQLDYMVEDMWASVSDNLTDPVPRWKPTSEQFSYIARVLGREPTQEEMCEAVRELRRTYGDMFDMSYFSAH